METATTPAARLGQLSTSNISRFIDVRAMTRHRRIATQDIEFDMLKKGLVCGCKRDGWRDTDGECLHPSGRANAPSIAGLEAREAELRSWRRQVVAVGLREDEERLRDLGADCVRADVLGSCRAVP